MTESHAVTSAGLNGGSAGDGIVDIDSKPSGGIGRAIGLGLTGLTGTVVLGLCVVGLPFFIVPWLPRKLFGALPYLPTGPVRCNAMLDRLPKRVTAPGQHFIDLGSGDGEAVLVAAQRGMIAHGVELNPSLVAFSKLRAWRGGLRDTASFSMGNLLEADVSPYSVVFVFGVVPLMPRIAAKLAAECAPDAYVCCHKFPLTGSGWEAARVGEVGDIYLYARERLPRGAASGDGGGGESARATAAVSGGELR